MRKFEVSLRRTIIDLLVVEVEAWDEECARRKALKMPETQLDSDAWCDGSPAARRIKSVREIGEKQCRR